MQAEVIRMNENSWRIEDNGVRFFLLAGTERALLISITITVSIRDTNKPAGIILSDPEGNEYYFPAAVEKDGNGVPTVIYETSR